MDYTNLPYPNLIGEFAKRNQHAFFREPVGERSADNLHKLPESVVEKLVKKHAPTFGPLSPMYKNVAGQLGPQQLTFFRENRGSIDHGLGRDNEDEYECAKFNILRHPRPDDHNNPAYCTEKGPVTGLNGAYLRLAHYPNVPGTVMSAPLLPRYEPVSEPHDRKDGHFRMPKAQQPSAFTRVLATTELCEKLMLAIGHRWEDLSNFSRTCQTVMYALDNASTRVDLLQNEFLGLHKTDEQIEKERGRGWNSTRASATMLIISNIRGRYREAKGGEGPPNQYGYPAAPKGTYERLPATRRIPHPWMLLKSVDLCGPQMKFLHLHAVPNIDANLLRRCLRGLPNLEVLGVHNCELLHFGMTMEVLKVVIHHNKEPGYKRVRSDFSPYYYTGPRRYLKGFRGEYSVIPSDPGTVDTRRAVAAVLSTVIPMAVENQIDWFSPGTGMRQFLERIPFALGTVRYILEAIHNIYHFETRIIHDLEKKEFPEHTFIQLRDAMRRTLNSDLVLAVNGRSMDSKILNATMTRGLDFHLVTCAFCHIQLPAWFYTRQSCSRQKDQIECCGCQLLTILDYQVDNFFQEKRETLRLIFNDPRFTGMKQYLDGTRIATPAEIQDPGFPFWEAAATPKREFLDAVAAGTVGGLLLLDQRPGPGFPNRYKKVLLWQERAIEAFEYAKANIDEARDSINKEIARGREMIRRLDDANLDVATAAQARANTDAADKAEQYVNQKLAVLGEGQMVGKHGTTIAPSWSLEIEKYSQLVIAQVGLLENKAPFPIWNNVADNFW